MIDLTDCVLAGAAGLLAGIVNAVAGGGSLISFPALLALGIPAVPANVTNTVALCPGYLTGAVAQRRDLAGQRNRLLSLTLVAASGGLAGSLLLLNTNEGTFSALVPYLILLACGLLAAQDVLRNMIVRRRRSTQTATHGDAPSRAAAPAVLNAAVFFAATYGGYFGGGLGIVLLAILGILIDAPLTNLNATKQVLSTVINIVAALFFVFSGEVIWPIAAAMGGASLVGGHLGGRLASRLPPVTLRLVVVAYGSVVIIAIWLT